MCSTDHVRVQWLFKTPSRDGRDTLSRHTLARGQVASLAPGALELVGCGAVRLDRGVEVAVVQLDDAGTATRLGPAFRVRGVAGQLREIEQKGRLGLVGFSLPRLSARAVGVRAFSHTGDDVVGEIWVRSPSCARGYWKREPSAEDFAAVLDEHDAAWLRTGDLGLTSERPASQRTRLASGTFSCV